MLPEAHSSERGEGGGGNKEEQPDRIHRPDEMVIWVFFLNLVLSYVHVKTDHGIYLITLQLTQSI